MGTSPAAGTRPVTQADRCKKAPGDICDANLVLLGGARNLESVLQHWADGPAPGDGTSDDGAQAVELGQLGWAESGFQLKLHGAACSGF